MPPHQLTLFDNDQAEKNTTTFVNNLTLPVHRWFRYSAGFSASWAKSLISNFKTEWKTVRVFDPFAGSATTLLAAEEAHIESYGVESHPFVARIARAKLLRQQGPDKYREFANRILRSAQQNTGNCLAYPDLIHRCFSEEHLEALDRLRCAWESFADGSPASELTWLTLVSILRRTSHVGTAQWQYVLPNKSKKNVLHPFEAFLEFSRIVYKDMSASQEIPSLATFVESDARTCDGVPDGFANLVITSPPYPNNYDYADATRLEMMFMREIAGWGDLQETVRTHLVRSCSQHTTTKNTDWEQLLASQELEPIAKELRDVVERLADVRKTKGGKKNYHLMVTAYFYDLAQVWRALRRVCSEDSTVCFVIGDSAPYGVYVPVAEWLGQLATAAGFKQWRFEKLRERNTKWKNRKHRVPLCEGRLWVQG